MTYAQVKQAWYDESFDLVLATQEQISKLEAEMEKNEDWHGVDWLQSRYDDFKEEMMEITNECITEFQSQDDFVSEMADLGWHALTQEL